MSLPRETMEIFKALAPELAESEDERIRKAIVETIKQCPDTFLNPKNRDEMLAYLEKQKEQKTAENWKPSEEQMEALDNARFCKAYDRTELDSLYEHLIYFF